MKITRPDGSIIEGSPEELARYETFSKSPQRSDENSAPVESADGDWEFVSTDVAFRALTRLKLGKQARTVLRRVYSAGDKWTSATRIQEEIDYTPAQFAGLMGALGRRVANTPGYVRDSSFWEYEWDGEQSCYLYRLPPSVRAALERARVVP